MPPDLTALADPPFVLLAWAAGLALAAGFVTVTRVVGPGFTWLSASVAGLISLGGVLAGGAWWAWVGPLALLLAILWARNGPVSGIFQMMAAVIFVAQASLVGGVIPTASVTLALGGVTGEMLLGHWYLIDPKLPRWALRILAVGGIGGLTVDAVVLSGVGLPTGGATPAYWVLTATSVVLMAGVLGSLRYPAYSGVMAATGLSYLAVLTSLGAVFLGRVLVAGLGPFGS